MAPPLGILGQKERSHLLGGNLALDDRWTAPCPMEPQSSHLSNRDKGSSESAHRPQLSTGGERGAVLNIPSPPLPQAASAMGEADSSHMENMTTPFRLHGVCLGQC